MLDAYSQRFADALFAEFPDWRQYRCESLPEVFSGDTEGILLVAVPCPTPCEEDTKWNRLLVDTDDGEITVTWDHYHTHFDGFAGMDEAEEFSRAIDFIKEILSETLCIAVAKADGKWYGSMSIEPGDTPEFHASLEDVPYYIRSWYGTYNKALAP